MDKKNSIPSVKNHLLAKNNHLFGQKNNSFSKKLINSVKEIIIYFYKSNYIFLHFISSHYDKFIQLQVIEK